MTTEHGAWRKSSYSGNQGGECVEVAPLAAVIGVRDSKDSASPVISTDPEAWAAFLKAVR